MLVALPLPLGLLLGWGTDLAGVALPGLPRLRFLLAAALAARPLPRPLGVLGLLSVLTGPALLGTLPVLFLLAPLDVAGSTTPFAPASSALSSVLTRPLPARLATSSVPPLPASLATLTGLLTGGTLLASLLFLVLLSTPLAPAFPRTRAWLALLTSVPLSSLPTLVPTSLPGLPLGALACLFVLSRLFSPASELLALLAGSAGTLLAVLLLTLLFAPLALLPRLLPQWPGLVGWLSRFVLTPLSMSGTIASHRWITSGRRAARLPAGARPVLRRFRLL